MSNFVEIKDKDGVTLGQLPVSSEGGRLRRITKITTTQVYTKPPWLKFAMVYGQAPGGGAGGIAATSGTQFSMSAAGSAGGYFEKFFLASELDAETTVTIGAAGVGGAAGANDGTDGESISFGSHCTAAGGGRSAGKAAITNTASQNAGAWPGGVAVGGDINISGLDGTAAIIVSGAFASIVNGAPSKYSSGGVRLYSSNSDSVCAGYGGGGGGAVNIASQSARAGGHGAPGIVIIEEYE